jgi:hypothetical protein
MQQFDFASQPGRILQVWTAGLIVFVAALVGCDKSEKGTAKDAGGGTSNGTTASADQYRGTLYKLTPEQYFKEYSDNDEAVRRKYGNGLIELTGIVDRVGIDLAANSTVTLRAGPQKEVDPNTPVTNPLVMCRLTETEPWAKVARGQQATLRGSVGNPPFSANLTDCQLITSGPSTVVIATAAQLAGEYVGKIDTFAKVNKDKNLIVTGKVARTKLDSAGAVTLFLEGLGATEVRCDFGMIESVIKKTVADVKAGQQVKVFGEVDPKAKPEDGLAMTSCHLITK